ncbi:MAG: ABC transporter permease [Candidatus Marinimicrobia bacterium]|nr:ABC transporter permease [Candidatus Neomarinimicrobiota bacterium]MCF7827705.1 ABC transporter permease [Candidatus Neomarinimicrobiota bacterium]MCF7881240.1 ABC transporter permease [Candidatus Neomarinimicrobiota bacterium]
MSAGFLIKEGFTGLTRAKFPSFVAILTITISLTLLGMAYLGGTNLYRGFNAMKSQFGVEVFLLPSATDYDRSRIEEQLEQSELVSGWEYVTKEDAAKRFREEFGENINEVLDANPLPESYTVFLDARNHDYNDVSLVAQELSRMNGVDEVQYRQGLLRLLDRYFNAVLIGGGIILAIILGAAILLVANTIKLSIFAKREVIRIMRLVGATDLFIKTPFIIEGLLQGIIGAGLSLGILYGAIQGTNYLLRSFFQANLAMDLPMIVGVIGAGILFGLLGSYRSIKMFITQIRI